MHTKYTDDLPLAMVCKSKKPSEFLNKRIFVQPKGKMGSILTVCGEHARFAARAG